jgi:hypothetical protein
MQSASMPFVIVLLRHWQRLTRDSTRIASLQRAMGREALMSELGEALQLAAARPEIQQMQMAFPQPLSEKYLPS